MMTVAAGAGGGPLRSKSARLPSVTLARAAPGPPVQLRWTTLRVQGPTLRDAALANGGNGSPPVAPQLLHPLHLDQRQMSRSPCVRRRRVGSSERSCAVGILVAGHELVGAGGQAAGWEREACVSIGS